MPEPVDGYEHACDGDGEAMTAARGSREVESANDRYAIEHPHGDWHVASTATVGKLWTFRDLPDEELRAFALLACECVTVERAGTRHGFRCPAHRAQDELGRRAES